MCPLGLHFTRDDSYSKVHNLLDIGRGVMKQGNGATDVEAADNHIHPGSTESPGKIDSAWVLIGLYPHQAHHSFPAGSLAAPDNLGNVDLMDGFVKEFNRHFQILTQRSTPLDIFSERIETGQRVAWQYPSPMTQYIAIVIVLRGFKQHDVEAANALRTLRNLTLVVSRRRMNGKQRHDPGSLPERRCMLHPNAIAVTYLGNKLGDYTRFRTTSLGFLKKYLSSLGPYSGLYLGKRLCFKCKVTKLVSAAVLVSSAVGLA